MCVYCLDKPRYGGPGTKRQKCVLKQNEVSHATRIVPAALKTSSWPTRTSALRARETLRKCIADEGKRKDTGCDDKQRASSSVVNVTKRHRCGVCVGCNATNCGRCVYCLDMLQFGGTGNLRQSCIERRCVEITKEDERLAEERRVEREAERELRQAEREAEREARAAERTERGGGARRFGGSTVAAAAAAVAKHTGFMPGTNARLPSVRLEASIDGGWGRFEFLPGMRVEVILPQEDVLGLMAGRVVDPYSEQPPPPKSSSSPRRIKSGPRHANPAAAEAAVAAAAAAHAAVVEAAVKVGKVCVEYDELLSEAHLPVKVPLREFIEPQRLRMLPPSAFPNGAACLLRPGDLVDLYYQNGWWEVVIQAVKEPAACDGLKRGQRGKRQRGNARKSAQPAVAVGDGGGAHDAGGAPEATADTITARSGVVTGVMDARWPRQMTMLPKRRTWTRTWMRTRTRTRTRTRIRGLQSSRRRASDPPHQPASTLRPCCMTSRTRWAKRDCGPSGCGRTNVAYGVTSSRAATAACHSKGKGAPRLCLRVGLRAPGILTTPPIVSPRRATSRTVLV